MKLLRFGLGAFAIALLIIFFIISKHRQFLTQEDTTESVGSDAQPPKPVALQRESEKKAQSGFMFLSPNERAVQANALRKLSPLELFRIWIVTAHIEHDSAKHMLVGELLAQALQSSGNSAQAYDEIKAFVTDNTNSLKERCLMIHILGLTATNPALSILLENAKNASAKEQIQISLQEIGSIGEKRWGGRFHEELSPQLESAWKISTNLVTTDAIALAIGQIGADSGVRLLISSALARSQEEGSVTLSAERGLLEVRNPSANAVLAQLLDQYTSRTKESVLISGVLAHMVSASSTQALLRWFQKSDESVGSLAQAYASHARSEEAMNVWESALNAGIQFKEEKNREAIRAGINQYRKTRVR